MGRRLVCVARAEPPAGSDHASPLCWGRFALARRPEPPLPSRHSWRNVRRWTSSRSLRRCGCNSTVSVAGQAAKALPRALTGRLFAPYLSCRLLATDGVEDPWGSLWCGRSCIRKYGGKELLARAAPTPWVPHAGATATTARPHSSSPTTPTLSARIVCPIACVRQLVVGGGKNQNQRTPGAAGRATALPWDGTADSTLDSEQAAAARRKMRERLQVAETSLPSRSQELSPSRGPRLEMCAKDGHERSSGQHLSGHTPNAVLGGNAGGRWCR